MALRTKRADGIDLTDPLEQVSLAGWFAGSILLLLLATAWSIYEEVYGLRPWKTYQAQFVEAAKKHYQTKLAEAKKRLAALEGEGELDDAKQALVDAEAAFKGTEAERAALEKERNGTLAKLEKVRADLAAIRGVYQANIYAWEQADARGKDAFKKEIDRDEPTVLRLVKEMGELDGHAKKLGDQIFAFGTDKAAAEAKLNEYRAEVRKFEGLLSGMNSYSVEVRQHFVPALDQAVDRCVSCHAGAVESDLDDIAQTLATMPAFKGNLPKYTSLFRSHPGDHLKKHPPEKFGCTSCHAGDGFSLATEWESHGTHHHHEYPLLAAPPGAREPPAGASPEVAKKYGTVSKEKFGKMAEAGCNKCHLQAQDLPGAPLLSYGKQLFTEVGCIACHKAKGIWPEADELDAAIKAKAALAKGLMEATKQAKFLSDEEAKDEELRRIKSSDEITRLANLNRQEQIDLADRLRDTETRIHSLALNVKKLGPNLINVKDKLRPDWIKEWLLNPHAFSPDAKMPNFYLSEGQAEALAAYLWQNGTAPTPGHDRAAPSDAETLEKGRKLFVESGCLACHVGGSLPGQAGPLDVRTGIEGTDVKKRSFGPTLVRTGEKARFDYLARWIHDPKSLAPQTRMPNMRLSKAQSEAIAAYLAAQTEKAPPAASWSQVPAYLEDPAKAKEGFELIQRNGCYSCHNIQGRDADGKTFALDERFGRIGVELSAHGSKNLHLFDFGLIEKKVAAAHHPGVHHPNLTRYEYITYKMKNPRSFEEGRYYTSPTADEHLKMPDFKLSPEETHAIGTFVVGLVEKEVPLAYQFNDAHPHGAIHAGRNLTLKHNCITCHRIENRGGQVIDFFDKVIGAGIPASAPDGDKPRNWAPPDLYSQGRKTRPEWLFHFLKAPFNMRPLARVRMPYFELSDDEAQRLVRYFGDLDSQVFPYQTRPAAHLNAEQFAWTGDFIEKNCIKCHQLREKMPEQHIAPSLNLAAERLQPEWVADWVRDPASFIPGTNMPGFKGAFPDDRFRQIADYLQLLHTPYQPREDAPQVDIHRSESD